MRLIPVFFALLPLPLAAQEVSSTATGNFGGQGMDGWFYQAEVYRNAEYLALRIWESPTGADGSWALTLDNPRFDWTPVDGTEWLEADPEGPLILRTETLNDGYLYSNRIVLSHMDNMIAVMSFATYNNPLDGDPPEETAACFADGCWSCEADVWNGAALAGGEAITAPVAYEDVNASLWHPERAIELGLCPGYD